jgi:hypothetical protein
MALKHLQRQAKDKIFITINQYGKGTRVAADYQIDKMLIVSVYTTGDEDKSLQPGIDGGIYYRRCKVQSGVEFYSNFKEKTASVFPSANIFLSPHISWNLGLGFGLNRESDDMTIKSILQFDVMAIRPSKLFSKRINKR